MFRSTTSPTTARCRLVESFGHSLPAGRSLSPVVPCRVPSCFALACQRRSSRTTDVRPGERPPGRVPAGIFRLHGSRHREVRTPTPRLSSSFPVCATKPLNCGTTLVPWHFGHFTSLFSRLREGHDQFEGLVALLTHELIARHGISLVVSSP